MLLGIASNLISALFGFLARHLWTRWRQRRRQAGQAAILSGLETSAKFVFPPREDVESAFLPRISTEDFMAINNLISAFLQAGLEPPRKVVDSRHLSDAEQRQFNLVVICSSKTNRVTEEALALLKKMNPHQADQIPEFVRDSHTGRTVIRCNNGIFPSESFDQQGPDYTDIAMIVKSRSPWAAQKKVLIVAGIRGFGTWGAAEFLKKSGRLLWHKKGASATARTSKAGDFAALIKVKYRDCDIKETSLLHLVDLDEQPGASG
jgi:hypothetical protein